MIRRALLVAAPLLAAPPAPLTAQASVYGVLGIGLPGQAVGVRARSLGYGLTPFDAGSAVNPATAALFPRLNVDASLTSGFRSVSAEGTQTDGLRQTRFLYAMVGSRIGRSPVSLAISLGPYLDRTFDVTTRDTIQLRGQSVEVNDRFSADGGVSDVRVALGWRLARRVHTGVGVHILTGSTRIAATRVFSDSVFDPLQDSTQASFSGAGVSVGAVWNPTASLSLGAAFRTDVDLTRRVDGQVTDQTDLPIGITVGLALAPRRALRLSSSVTWRAWSAADLPDVNSFDTWEVGAGAELGGPDVGASRVPLRLGIRYAQLPFSRGDDQPREWVIAGGTAYPFAGNRALVEVALERIFRDGGGASERVWQISAGLSLAP